MIPVPMFGIGNQGRSLDVDAQVRTNLYAETTQDPEKNILILYPTPGLELFINLGETPIRGVLDIDNVLYAVHQSFLYAILNNGLYSKIGTLDTREGLVSMAHNGKEICIVDGQYGYIFDRSTQGFSRIGAGVSADGYVAADHVDFNDGRFVSNRKGTGQFCISAAYDGVTWDVLEFATAESSPDGLVRVISDSGILLLMGENTIEPWGNSGALDFPYTRIGSASIEWGLAARWSLVKFMDSLMFLRRNRLGQIQVCAHQSGAAQAVSTPEMDAVFAQYPAYSDAIGFAYMMNGHPFYQISFPSAKAVWLFDGQSRSWSKLMTGTGRHRAQLYSNLLGKKLVTDFENGKIYQLKDDVYTDDGEFIAREFISRHIGSGDYTNIASLWLEMEAGVGDQTGQGYDPQVMMSVSRDGGHTYGQERWATFGKIGAYRHRARWLRIGRARNWIFKFRITDPVKTVIIQAWGVKGG